MYQTLYRKYRPKKFEDIVGQEIIVKTLKNSIKNNKISHAYLFIGPRGTGKTSTAKIFARAVNCLNNNDGDICGCCDICNISGDDCLDIIEIDAASNNGVDEIRNLREKINLVPSELKYKVYIIDEVHMLTIQAFNALLKTLEEPPEHIIFILATTDPQKIPETIISRCQCFNFSRMTEQNIIDNLTMVSKKENIDVDIEVLKNIAIVSDGGMRDSLGMLDKLSSYSDGKILMNDFLNLNGLVVKGDLEELINYIFDFDAISTINFLEKWNDKGKNLIQIMIQLLNYLKEEIISEYINETGKVNIDNYQKLANLINEKMFDIKKSSNPKIYIEIMFLSFINNNKIISREIISNDKASIKKEENINESAISDKEKNHSVVNQVSHETSIVSDNNLLNSNIMNIMKTRLNNAFINATKEELNKDKNSFEKLNDFVFDQQIGYLVCALLEGNLRLSSEDYLIISYEYESVVLENLNNIDVMSKVLKEKLNINKKLAIITDSEWNDAAREYVKNKKNNITYKYIEEQELVFDKKEEKNINNNSAFDMFGDIVEVC